MLIEDIDFLYIAFQLTLFFLLTIALYKIIKGYLIPYLYNQIKKRLERNIELKNKDKLLNASNTRIVEQIYEQKNSFNVLEYKVKNWTNSLIEDENRKKYKNKELINKIKAKRKIQSENLSLLKMEQIVIPESIRRACKQIEGLYGGEKSLGLLKELIEKIEPDS